ncbi:MAG: 30S ribosomal protein S7 [Thermoplasmatota archaeon]
MSDEPTTEMEVVENDDQLAQIAEEETPEPEVPEVELPATPLFGKYGADGIDVRDIGLARYIKLTIVGLPHSSARHANKRFAKQKTNVVERLINNVMRSEVYNGKKGKAYRVVEDAFERVADKTKENPIQVLVQAIEHSAPREEVTRLRYGGINVPKAVDVSPQRRLDIALRNIAKGGLAGSHKSTKPAAHCLADEIIKASKADQASFAVAKKDDMERVAKSAR